MNIGIKGRYNWAIHPVQYAPCCITPADLGFDYETVSFSTEDGLMLVGWYIPGQNGAGIIAVHGYGLNRLNVIGHAEFLAEQGYSVLLFDLRAHGESEGEAFPFGWDADKDVLAALAFLQNQPEVDPERIGVLGVSIGGEVALQTAVATDQIKAVVSDGAGSRMLAEEALIPDPRRLLLRPGFWTFYKSSELLSGVPVATPLSELTPQIAPCPLLLISAGDSEEKPLNEIYYEAAGEPKELWHIPEAAHTQGLATRPETYKEKVLAFFDEALLK